MGEGKFPKVQAGSCAGKNRECHHSGWPEQCTLHTLYAKSHLVGLKWELRVCASDRPPGEANAAGSWTTLWVARGILPGVTAPSNSCRLLVLAYIPYFHLPTFPSSNCILSCQLVPTCETLFFKVLLGLPTFS